MANQSIVSITGGNTGIGYESVKALYASSQAHTILMGSRSLEKPNRAISTLKSHIPGSKSEVQPLQIDIEDDASSSRLLKMSRSAVSCFDVTIIPTTLAGIREAWNRGYNLNTMSTQIMTHVFAPLLIAADNALLLFVTSGSSTLTTCAEGSKSKIVHGPSAKGRLEPPAPTQTAYRASKSVLNKQMLEWRRRLVVDRVKVSSASPGFLATDLRGMGSEFLQGMGAEDPSVGGVFKDVIEGKRNYDKRKVISEDGVQPW